MFDMQANASNLQPVQPPLDGSTGSDDSFSSQPAQQGGANDGSAAAPATAAPADGATPSASSNSSAGGANVLQNNLLERLIQMQAQLINPATVQDIATV